MIDRTLSIKGPSPDCPPENQSRDRPLIDNGNNASKIKCKFRKLEITMPGGFHHVY